MTGQSTFGLMDDIRAAPFTVLAGREARKLRAARGSGITRVTTFGKIKIYKLSCDLNFLNVLPSFCSDQTPSRARTQRAGYIYEHTTVTALTGDEGPQFLIMYYAKLQVRSARSDDSRLRCTPTIVKPA